MRQYGTAEYRRRREQNQPFDWRRAPKKQNRTRLDDDAVVIVRNLVDRGLRPAWVAEKFGVARSTVSQIVNRRRRANV